MALGPSVPTADRGNDPPLRVIIKIVIKSGKKSELWDGNRSCGEKIGALGVGKSLMHSLPTNKLQSWSQPEWGPPDANSPPSAKGIGLSMRTHCQTAVLLPYLAPRNSHSGFAQFFYNCEFIKTRVCEHGPPRNDDVLVFTLADMAQQQAPWSAQRVAVAVRPHPTPGPSPPGLHTVQT